MKIYLALLFFLSLASLSYAQNKQGIVTVPVCDLRSSIGTPLPQNHAYDPHQESQLLYGEGVEIISEKNGWYHVEAKEQLEFSHNNRWQGYPGWIQKENVSLIKEIPPKNYIVQKKTAKLYTEPHSYSPHHFLSLGTKLSCTPTVKNGFREVRTIPGQVGWIKNKDIRSLEASLTEKGKRKMILSSAKELLGDTYFWGGKSAYIPQLINQVTGVDCSGLVLLSYSVAGMDIPRDAYEQFLKCTRIQKKDLKEGDLLFSADPKQPEKVTHVALYLDKDSLLEGPQTGKKVRIISFKKKYNHLERVFYFGTYLTSP